MGQVKQIGEYWLGFREWCGVMLSKGRGLMADIINFYVNNQVMKWSKKDVKFRCFTGTDKYVL